MDFHLVEHARAQAVLSGVGAPTASRSVTSVAMNRAVAPNSLDSASAAA